MHVHMFVKGAAAKKLVFSLNFYCVFLINGVNLYKFFLKALLKYILIPLTNT